MTNDIRCTRCGKCQEVCPTGAIVVDQESRRIDRSKCNLCLECAQVCPMAAIVVSGSCMTLDQVMKEIESDRLFYQNSGGGATLSGGEPLMQWEFALDLLMACRAGGIHTALDTSGHAPWDVTEKVLEYTDLALFDIKHMDTGQHRRATGKGNELILENARRTAAKVRTWIRVPLIPGYNASEDNLESTARFALEIGAEKVSLLPYHVWGEGKWTRLGKRYPMQETSHPSDEFASRCQETVERVGATVTVGR